VAKPIGSPNLSDVERSSALRTDLAYLSGWW